MPTASLCSDVPSLRDHGEQIVATDRPRQPAVPQDQSSIHASGIKRATASAHDSPVPRKTDTGWASCTAVNSGPFARALVCRVSRLTTPSTSETAAGRPPGSLGNTTGMGADPLTLAAATSSARSIDAVDGMLTEPDSDVDPSHTSSTAARRCKASMTRSLSRSSSRKPRRRSQVSLWYFDRYERPESGSRMTTMWSRVSSVAIRRPLCVRVV